VYQVRLRSKRVRKQLDNIPYYLIPLLKLQQGACISVLVLIKLCETLVVANLKPPTGQERIASSLAADGGGRAVARIDDRIIG
jgi:hypothetical protein